jgi:PAS domain S-box-containing protein
LFKSILDVMHEAICLCDQTGGVLYMNSAAKELMRWQEEDRADCHESCRQILINRDAFSRKSRQIDFSKSSYGSIELNGRLIYYSISPLQNKGLPGIFLISLKSTPEDDLRKRDRILAGAALVTNQLLITNDLHSALNQILEILGCSADVDRVYIFKNYDTKAGEHCCKLSYDWFKDGISAKKDRSLSTCLSYNTPIPWYENLARGMPHKGLTRDRPLQSRMFLEQLSVLSFLIVPIFIKDIFWGFIGFDDRKKERIWTWDEVSVLMTIAGAIGASLDRWKTQAALRESEQKYRELVESANSIIMRIDISGNITFINKYAQDFFGYRQAEIIGSNAVGTIIPAMDSEGRDLRKMIECIACNPDAYAANVNENMRSNGERVWISWTNRPVQNENGEIVEILCIGNDLTENKRSSERLKKTVQDLRETRDYLEKLIGNANAPIIVWDPSFRITRFNQAFERLTGHPAEEVMGRHLDVLFPEVSKAVSSAYIEKTLFGEHWDAVEIPILRKDGEVRTVLWNSAAIYDEGGQRIVATIAQGQDITERKEAESQVIFQASLLDQVRNAVIATDLGGRIIYWNHFSEVLYQWKADEVIGKSIAETIVPGEMNHLIKDVIEDIIRYGYRECELMVRRKDGCLFPASYTFNVLKDNQGRCMGFVGVSIDLTERKRAEMDMLLAKERAESATKAKSEFLANMSHEIRTPMNAVIGLTGLLLNTNIDLEQRDCIETIRSSGDALLAVISDILDFSKIEGGMLDLEKEPFDLQKCLDASANMVSQAAAEKGLKLEFNVDLAVPRRLLGDMTRLKQILVNLLGNAVKFTDAGEISVSVSSQPKDGKHEIMFAVKDTGIGIDKDRMSRLFQSFSQVDASTTRKYGGTGLGLAISRNLAELLGGRIWAKSEPGKGSVFYFTIFAQASLLPDPLEPKGEHLLAVTGQENVARKHLCIMLAEDNVVNQKVATRMLERLGYKADIAANGRQVLGALQSHPYDVVLMDVQMPDMDGLEATRRIRCTPGRQPYIIAMTAHAMKGDREECLAAGMDDYVSKPVRMEELQAAIERGRSAVGPDETQKSDCKP